MSQEPLTYAEIYRQIAIIGAEGADFDRLKLEIRKILKGVEYTVIAEVPELRLIAIQVAPGENVLRILEELRGASAVESAEQNQVGQTYFVVDDPLYRHQWALWRIGAEPAWAHALATLNPAAPGVVVAIVDSGITVGHPDLAMHLWDDGAGHHGRNVLTNTFNVADRDGHGTMLAAAIGVPRRSPVLAAAIAFANSPPPFLKLPRAVVITAAGNDGLDNDVLPTYPANYGSPPYNLPNVVSLMASKRPDYDALVALDLRDDKAWFSNYGRTSVHLAAPGVGVLTTDTYFGTPRWRAYNGTSAACAHGAYAAALLAALNPMWTPNDIRTHLMASVDWSPWLACASRGRLSLDRAVVGPFVIVLPAAGIRWPVGANVEVIWNNRYQTPLAQNV